MNKLSFVVRAYLALAVHDLFMSCHGFASLHRRVKSFPLRPAKSEVDMVETLTAALDVACCFYPKQALCLQRSAVLVRMLRQNGVPAQMIIGVQKLPFKAHAWVEVNGQIINDRLASREKFLVLEVC